MQSPAPAPAPAPELAAADRVSRVPTAVLAHVYSFLDMRSHTRLARAARCYSATARLAAASPYHIDFIQGPLRSIAHWRPEALSADRADWDDIRVILGMASSLRALSLTTRLEHGALACLSLLTRLNQLDLFVNDNGHRDTLLFAAHLPFLTRVSTSLGFAEHIPATVQSLTMGDPRDDTEFLQRLPALTQLHTRANWTEREMFLIGGACPQLAHFEFDHLTWSHARLVSPGQMAAAFPKLDVLRCTVRDHHTNEAGPLAELVAAISSLRDLTIGPGSTSTVIFCFPPRLRRLDLSGNALHDAHVACISQLLDLRALSLNNCKLPFKVERLSALTALTELGLAGCNLAKAAVLPRIGPLLSLDLGGENLVPSNLAAAFPSLAALYLPASRSRAYIHSTMRPPPSLRHVFTSDPHLCDDLAAHGIAVRPLPPTTPGFPVPALAVRL